MINNTSLDDPSQGSDRSCQRIAAFLLAIPAVLMLSLSLWVLNLQMTILSPSFLKGIPVHNGLYDHLPEMILGIMADQTFYDQEDVEEFKRTIGLQPLKEFVNALIPPAWVQDQVENNIDLFFSWLEGERPYPNLDFRYGDISERVRSNQARSAMRNLFSNLPSCESEKDFY